MPEIPHEKEIRANIIWYAYQIRTAWKTGPEHMTEIPVQHSANPDKNNLNSNIWKLQNSSWGSYPSCYLYTSLLIPRVSNHVSCLYSYLMMFSNLDHDLSVCTVILIISHSCCIQHLLGGDHRRSICIFITVIHDRLDPCLNNRLGTFIAGEQWMCQGDYSGRDQDDRVWLW